MIYIDLVLSRDTFKEILLGKQFKMSSNDVLIIVTKDPIDPWSITNTDKKILVNFSNTIEALKDGETVTHIDELNNVSLYIRKGE